MTKQEKKALAAFAGKEGAMFPSTDIPETAAKNLQESGMVVLGFLDFGCQDPVHRRHRWGYATPQGIAELNKDKPLTLFTTPTIPITFEYELC